MRTAVRQLVRRRGVQYALQGTPYAHVHCMRPRACISYGQRRGKDPTPLLRPSRHVPWFHPRLPAR